MKPSKPIEQAIIVEPISSNDSVDIVTVQDFFEEITGLPYTKFCDYFYSTEGNYEES